MLHEIDPPLWTRDEDRSAALLPYLLRLVGATSDEQTRRARAFVAADFAVRRFLPRALERVEELAENAERIRALSPIVDARSARRGAAACRTIHNVVYYYVGGRRINRLGGGILNSIAIRAAEEAADAAADGAAEDAAAAAAVVASDAGDALECLDAMLLVQ
jgi:hypothetical protein